ncbi:chromosome partitioning protein ParB [Bacteroidia bacterium]|nr:chromosome partitioning protein ParB [Bacteroidia bacterium]
MAKQKQPALGKGLGALISMDAEVHTSGSSSINEIELAKITPNPDQPRTLFDEATLEELAASIRAVGVVQPITLRETGNDRYQIISGERRYRAALKADLDTIPAYIKTASDENVKIMALIENIQREDLNAIETALAFQALIENYQLTQEKLSEQIGKKRATIANYLRLLKLPAEIQIGLRDKKIDMGHAKLILSVENPSDQLYIYESVVEQGLSVRRTEEIIAALNQEKALSEPENSPKKSKSSVKRQAQEMTEAFQPLKKHLSDVLAANVNLTLNEKGAGKITIAFANQDELEDIIQRFDAITQR